MIHKCPDCKVPLVPITRVGNNITWVSQKMSAERTIHLNKVNYCAWQCPECDNRSLSELQIEFLYSHTYAGLEKALRKK